MLRRMKGATRRDEATEKRGAARARAAAALGALASALLGGCADRACVQWSEQEGACPSQREALSFMPILDCVAAFNGQPDDGDSVLSVDSEGDFEGDVCCYDVTFARPDRDALAER